MSQYFHRTNRLHRFQPVIGISLASLFGLSLFFHSTTVNAQSTVVQVPSESVSAQNEGLNASLNVRSDLTSAFLQTEQRLAQPTPAAWRSEMTVQRLLQQMRSVGFRIKLDASSKSNNFDEETRVRMALRNASIAENLHFVLVEYDCEIRITQEGTLHILSRDHLLDTLDRVTYDIGHLASDFDQVEEIRELIQETIDPDSWEPNGGTGRIQPISSNRGWMIVVLQTYRNQVSVRQQLATITRLGGGGSMHVAGSFNRNGPARPVQLPEEYLALRRNRRGLALPGSGTTSGFGGGAGLGGGVF